MASTGQLLRTLVSSAVSIAVMVVFATVAFFIITFVVSTGSSLAGYEPSGDFVVLSAALIVVAIILTGGLTPRMADRYAGDPTTVSPDDPTYD